MAIVSNIQQLPFGSWLGRQRLNFFIILPLLLNIVVFSGGCETFRESDTVQTAPAPLPYEKKSPDDMRDQEAIDASEDVDDENKKEESGSE